MRGPAFAIALRAPPVRMVVDAPSTAFMALADASAPPATFEAQGDPVQVASSDFMVSDDGTMVNTCRSNGALCNSRRPPGAGDTSVKTTPTKIDRCWSLHCPTRSCDGRVCGMQ